jgi:probable F420-dependent oxidoreductase
MELGSLAAWMNLDPLSPQQAAEAAARVESLGYSALWYPDSPAHDALTRASVLLSATSTIVVATGITQIYNRPAWSAGAGQRVLYDQSDGRFLLGLGVSHRSAVEGRGLTYAPAATAMAEYLTAIDDSLATGTRALTDKAATVDRPSLREARMPRVIAALGPRMLGLARQASDGAHTYLVTPEHTRFAREVLGEERWLCAEQKVLHDTDASRARAVARGVLALYLGLPNYVRTWRRLGFGDDDFVAGGSDRLVDSLVAWGDEDAIARRLTEHLDAGATQVCVQALDSGDASRPTGPNWSTLERVAALLPSSRTRAA